MQPALFSQTTFSQTQPQASNDDSFHDDNFHDEESPWRMVLCVLANVIGGAILLSGMFILPHVIARIFIF